MKPPGSLGPVSPHSNVEPASDDVKLKPASFVLVVPDVIDVTGGTSSTVTCTGLEALPVLPAASVAFAV